MAAMRVRALVAVVVGACGGGRGAGGAIGGDPRAPDQDVAIVGTRDGLVAVALATGKTRALTDEDVSWCAVDDRARVVWFTTPDDGGDTFALRWFDLVDGGEVRTAYRGAPTGLSEVIIDHGDAGRIGGTDTVSFFVGVTLHLVAPLDVGAEIGCEGDAWHYCYEDVEGGDLDDAPLRAEYEGYRKAADALALEDRAGLDALVTRGRGRALWSPAPPDSAEMPRVDAVPEERCQEEPTSCGRAAPLPGTPYWMVVIDNARGDYFHETRSLYDPATREFFRADDPAVRSTAPIDGAGIEGLLVAPSGAGGAIAGRVVDFRRGAGVVWQSDDASVCGWIGGGHRIGGPRD